MDQAANPKAGRKAAKLLAKDLRVVTSLPVLVRTEPWFDKRVACLLQLKREDRSTDSLIPVYFSVTEEVALRQALTFLRRGDALGSGITDGAIRCPQCLVQRLPEAGLLSAVANVNGVSWVCNLNKEHRAPVGRLVNLYEYEDGDEDHLPTPIEQAEQRLLMMEVVAITQTHGAEILRLVESADDRDSARDLLRAELGFDPIGAEFALDTRFAQFTRLGKSQIAAEMQHLRDELAEIRGA